MLFEEYNEKSYPISPVASSHTEDDSAQNTISDGDDVFSTEDDVYGLLFLLQISTSCQTLDFTAQSVIQAEDLSIVKYYFDTCVSTCESEASDETKAEYEAMMQDQNNLQSLKNLGSDVMDWVVRIVNWSEKDMLKN